VATKADAAKAKASADTEEAKADVSADATADATAETPAEAAPAGDNPVVSDCVVNGGKGMHVGRAVNGKVCSYHAMHYDRDGNRR